MFGNLRLCEIPPTLLSYQVLPKQIQFLTCVPCQILIDFFFTSFYSNLYWFFIHWHIKFSALLHQFRCFLVGCFTFTLIVYPLQCQWYLIFMSNMVKCLCFKFFKSYVLSDYSSVIVLHFTGKPNLT